MCPYPEAKEAQPQTHDESSMPTANDPRRGRAADDCAERPAATLARLRAEIEVITQTSVGGWLSRERVWTDTNENGIQDPAAMPSATNSACTLGLP